VTAKRAANVSPDAVKQNAHPLLVALTEELLTFNRLTASLLVALTEEPLASGLHHVLDLLKVDLLQTETLDTKRS
jgi:hypothetical protein|tara:strand:- start:876 stop:1100 length:225 start_codon:yes stop_codon:yes gene_type:complete